MSNDTSNSVRIGLFFDKIHPWIPIMHRPSFYDKYMQRCGQHGCLVSRQSVSADESIMIYAMFALTARFSKADFFGDTDVVDRGETFAAKAAVIKDPLLRTLEEPSLDFLKGCLLLSCHSIAAGQISAGALLTAACVRMAYSLGLNGIDDDHFEDDGTYIEKNLDSEAFVHREDLRRVWWALSDLDTFVCTISCQPFGIERRNMRVLLPVSDVSWFSGRATRSPVMRLQPSQIWKTLQDPTPQPARNWFLVSNHLASCIADTARWPSRPTLDQITELEGSLSCLRLMLPTDFQLRHLQIDAQNFVEGNWIISTHLMFMV